ncbi:MAG: aminotransferase class V-fold PLP-dependent enzyme, partial [Gemmataceae bacterium]|nr:aminotransferase class V-fold PLP-dependent enzyme [Gemmataceae bacterium]
SRPLRALEAAGTIALTRVKSDASGTVDPGDIRKAMTPRTRLVAITHASNVLGTVQPAEEIARAAHEGGALFLLDAAQTAGVLPLHAERMGFDLVAVPGHKSLLGPTGTGALYVGPRAKLRAWREGGTGGDSFSETQPTDYPFFLEGGTPNVAGLAGLAAGIRWVAAKGVDAIHRHETELCARLWDGLDGLGWAVLGHRDPARRVGTVSFRHEALPADVVGGVLDAEFGIAIRPGFHCAPYIHRALGTEDSGAVRASPGPFSTAADIDALLEALRQIGAEAGGMA